MWPTGIGVLWIDKQQARILQTVQWWGWIITDVTTEWSTLIRTADKFEPGTPNLIGAIGLWAACDFYTAHNIYEYIQKQHSLWKSAYDTIITKTWPLSLVWGMTDSTIGIASLSLSSYQEVGEKLADHNICVRVGGHCAHPLLSRLGIHQGLIRISPFVYNTSQDLEKLIKLL